MSTVFDRPLRGFRFVQTNRGDTLQLIAARELKDASRWTELVSLNNLSYPYITDDPSQAGAGVLLTGASITVPASVPAVSNTTDASEIFGSDLQLLNGRLQVADGDFAVVSGRPNLLQALKNRLETARNELIYHLLYGSLVPSLIGSVTGPTAALLAAEYAKQAVLSDPRISRVSQSSATAVGDTINTVVEAVPVSGNALTISATN